MYSQFFIAAGLLGLAQAQSYTPPGANTFGSLYTPDTTHPVTRGETFKVTWDPTGHTTDTISLVLCSGPSSNCVNSPTAIVSHYPASAASYEWTVPCSVTPGTASSPTGHGLLIIADGSGDFQYSTQFSVLEGTVCSGGNGSNSTTTTTTSTTSSNSTMTSTSSTYGSTWATMQNYSMTTLKPTSPSTVHFTSSVASATSAAPIATQSQFHGAATKIGGSAAALVMAAGAAFFAL